MRHERAKLYRKYHLIQRKNYPILGVFANEKAAIICRFFCHSDFLCTGDCHSTKVLMVGIININIHKVSTNRWKRLSKGNRLCTGCAKSDGLAGCIGECCTPIAADSPVVGDCASGRGGDIG